MELEVESRAIRGGYAGNDIAHELLDAVAHLFAQGADGAFHFNFIGEDILPRATVNGADGNDHWLEGVNAPALDGLESGDAFGGHNDGVNAFVWCGGVNHLAAN